MTGREVRPTEVDRQRLFHGVPILGDQRDTIRRVLGSALEIPGARWVPPGNLHLTIRFLGASTADQKERLENAVRALRDLPPPFTVRLRGWGAFPRPGRAEVLWVGIEDGMGGLRRLAEAFESAARAAGYPPENRPFRPHLTTARLRPAADLRRLLGTLPRIDIEVPVPGVTLFRSVLGRGPAVYERIAYHPLDSGGVAATNPHSVG